MASEMRLRFDDEEIKPKLEEIASAMGLSLNGLVNQIIKARFSEEDRKYLQLMFDIVEFQKEHPA